MLDIYLICLYEFYCGQCDVDVHISVADPDAALDDDPPFRDDPNDLIYEPETKTYAELTIHSNMNVTLYEDYHWHEC